MLSVKCGLVVLYILTQNTTWSPNAAAQQRVWIPNGEFSSIQMCRRAAQQLNYANGTFRCIQR